MIDRYTRAEMGKIWTLESKFQYCLDVELAVLDAYAQLGEIPKDVVDDIKSKAKFSIERIEEIEKKVGHDIIAFLTCVNENVGANSRYIHKGLTSSDVIDTALALQIKNANEIIKADFEKLISVLKQKIKQYKNTPCVGRSHGIIAEPMTFGVKLCAWLDAIERNFERFCSAADEIAVGQISGPVGTYSNITPEVEKLVCKQLGLSPAKLSTQVISRDYHAHYLQTLALIATAIEQCSIEIRHLQRTEVLEAEEGFASGQKGSSAMPHKRNPISSENLCGLARVVRANSVAAMENVPLWHERDISHSSVERIILPDSTILIDYMLSRFTGVVEKLSVYPDNMLKNLNAYGGIIFSQRVLLALTEKGLSREKAYELVQTCAFNAFNKENGDFKAEITKNSEINSVLTTDEINDCFDREYYLRNINSIYERFGV